MAVPLNILQNLQDRFFDSLVSNRLVYNTCWEDPRIDRMLLDIDSDSEIVMLTSAGCNSLDYLLDNPDTIHCIDSNPSQNALLEFKLALYRNRDFKTLWNFFGQGYHRQATHIYEQLLTPHISKQSQSFWKRNINYFTKNANESSFYFRGTSGKMALLIHRLIRRKGLYRKVLCLLNSRSLAEQAYYFEEIQEQLWNAFYMWLINQNTTLALLGVPVAQRNLIDQDHPDGLTEFILSSIRRVFTRLPVRDNYFWRVYLTGSYTYDCCPGYLNRECFQFLTDRTNRIDLYTGSLNQFLQDHPGSYSHFVLLDHQDWLAYNHPDLLAQEWKLILCNSRPGARILMRSAGTTLDFLPDFVFDHIKFNHQRVKNIIINDRVGTYGSTHLGIIQS